MRRAAWLLGLAAAVALLPACSSADGEAGAFPFLATTTVPAPAIVEPVAATVPAAVPAPAEPARFSLGEPDIQAVRVAAEIPEDVRNGIQALLDRYLNDAMLTPLREAETVGDLGAVFSGPALDRAAGPDRVALVDEGLPKVARLEVGDASAQLTALVGPQGVAVVAAQIHVLVRGLVSTGGLVVERTGELHLARDGDAWKVGSYDVSVTRSGPDGVITTTTTTSSP
jgi:hypothetical protein